MCGLPAVNPSPAIVIDGRRTKDARLKINYPSNGVLDRVGECLLEYVLVTKFSRAICWWMVAMDRSVCMAVGWDGIR